MIPRFVAEWPGDWDDVPQTLLNNGQFDELFWFEEICEREEERTRSERY